MKIVKFLKAGLENFCNHIEPFEIKFEDGKLILITGPNGAGKTSILQSIPYTLYGVCEKGRGEDVINEKEGKNCHSWVEFEVDNDTYRVDRYVKFSKFGNTVLISKNGEEPYKKGHKEVVPEIEKILVPAKLFNNTMLFSQKTKTFFTDLTDSEQKEIFRKILKLDDYIDYQNRAKNKLDIIQSDLNQITNQMEINTQIDLDIDNQIKELKDKKVIFENKVKEDIDKIKEEMNQNLSNLNNLEIKLKDLDEQNINNKIKENEKAIINIQTQIDSLNNDCSVKKDNIRSKSQIKESEFQLSFSTNKSELKNQFDLKTEKLKETFSIKKDEFQKSINELEKENISIENSINNIISNKDTLLSKLNMEFESSNSKIKEKYRIKNEMLKDKISSDKEESVKIISDLEKDDITLNGLISQYESEIQRLEKEKLKFNNLHIGEECPTCLQTLDNIDPMNNHISEISKEIKKYEKNIIDSNSKKELIKENIKFSGEKLSNTENKFQKEIDENLSIMEDELTKNSEDNSKKISKINDDILLNLNEKKTTKEELQNKINELNKEFKSFHSEVQNEANKNKEDYEKKFIDISDKFKDMIDKLNDIKLFKIKEIESENSKNLLKFNCDLKELNHKKEQLENIIENINEHKELINKQKSNIQLIEYNLQTKQKEKFDDNIFKSLNNKKKDLKNKISNLLIEITSLKRKQKIISFWKTGFSSSGIQSMLIDEAIPFMNSKVSEYLEQLSGGRYIISFDTMSSTKSGEFRDKINVEVFDTVTHSNKRIKFSGGQERIIDIATILTLSDLQKSIQNVSFNIMLFDEIFDSLDDNNIGQVANLIKKVSMDKSVFIISHRAIDQIEADETLNFN